MYLKNRRKTMKLKARIKLSWVPNRYKYMYRTVKKTLMESKIT